MTGDARTAVLLHAVLRKEAILLVRYPVNTLGGIAATYFFFALLFFGGRAVAPVALGETLRALVVGYFLATLAIASYQTVASEATREAQWGTLEQLYMSPFGFGRVVLATAVTDVLFSFLWGFSVLALMLVTTGERFVVHLPTVLFIGFFAVLSTMGVGFAFGGLAVLYKQVENVTGLVQPALIALVAAPATETPLVSLLPIVQGSAMLQRAMREDVHLTEFSPSALSLLVGVGIGYFVLGYAVFTYATDRARRLGVLGHY